MPERVTERVPLVIRPVVNGQSTPPIRPDRSRPEAVTTPTSGRGQLAAWSSPRSRPSWPWSPPSCAWRAGRRARRAADLVAQLLDPPVLEPPSPSAPARAAVPASDADAGRIARAARLRSTRRDATLEATADAAGRTVAEPSDPTGRPSRRLRSIRCRARGAALPSATSGGAPRPARATATTPRRHASPSSISTACARG